MIKIGVSAIGYECAEHLEEVLKPWIEVRDTFDVTISVAHGVFPETHKLGFPIISTDFTLVKLNDYKTSNLIQHAEALLEPTFEKDIRNATLPALFAKNIDYLVLLDLQDELYTVEDIKKIFGFVERNEFIPWFKINFKNYVFDNQHYVDDFKAPRIWRTNQHGGIKGFWYDNDIEYNDGSKAHDLGSMTIPQNVAFIKHLSWVGSPEYLKRKIAFQKIHYQQCSYKWNEEKNCLELDMDYYRKVGQPLPEVYYEK